MLLLEHVSLDGFLAGPHGEMDWIHVDDELFASSTPMYAHADAAIFGRVTYGMMAGYWPTAGDAPDASEHDVAHSRWINNATVYVFSNTLTAAPWGDHGHAVVVPVHADGLAAAVDRLKQQPGGDMVLIGSAGLARDFVAHDLVDEFYLFVNPVILGQGLSLFAHREHSQSLTLVESHPYPSGVVQLHYSRPAR
jgi:dihydrofolate reductase